MFYLMMYPTFIVTSYPTEMIKKLEIIIGSMVAGNNSIELRNTGVAILDILGLWLMSVKN